MYSNNFIFALYDFLVVCGREDAPASIMHVILDGLTTNRDEKSRIAQNLLQIDNFVKGKNQTCFTMERN